MTTADNTCTRFAQPKPWARWVALALAVAGWYVSWQSFRVSAGADIQGPFMQALCGKVEAAGGLDNCTSVLTSPQAHVAASRAPGAPRIPVSTFGMGYFAFLGLWYLFVGPPTRSRRWWHLVVVAVVFCGVLQSLIYIRIMAYELHRWCGSCLAAHAVIGGFAILTVLAWPWRGAGERTQPHPSGRLVLATATAGGLAFITHVALVFVMIAGSVLSQRMTEYRRVLEDPEFVLWDFNRQPAVSIPLYEDETFAGSPTAPNTIVVFSDFQCTHCRHLHEMVLAALNKHADELRVVFRYYPEDPECNANPQFRVGGHGAACRAARAVEAARVLGGREIYLRMQQKLWDSQAKLPTVPFGQQTRAQRQLFAAWAAELGLERAAFAEAFESPEVAARIQADIATAEALGLHAMPAVYLNGKRLVGWSKPATWDALLGQGKPPSTQPTSAPAVP